MSKPTQSERDEYIFKCAHRFQERFPDMTAREVTCLASSTLESRLQLDDNIDDPVADADEEMSVWAQDA